jgi:hypothetical protein
MKKVIYILIAVVFLSCSGSTHNNVEEYPNILTPETISFLLSEKPEEVDPGLYLYRNKLTRSIVENFYTRVTADRDITEAILAAADANDIFFRTDAHGQRGDRQFVLTPQKLSA